VCVCVCVNMTEDIRLT